MNDELLFTTPLPPTVNKYLGKRVLYNPVNNKPYVSLYVTQEALKYKKYVTIAIKRVLETSNWNKTDNNTYIICEIIVYSDAKRKDSDNMFKCLLDGINESGIIHDDSLIIPRVKNIYLDKKNPRLEVRLFVSKKKGIFDNEEELLKFKMINCYCCKRYKNNCSILKALLENKVKEEIVEGNCIKRK